MPNSGRQAVLTLCLAAVVSLLAGEARLKGQASAEQLFKEATLREATLRAEIKTRKAASPALPLLHRARILVGTYEDLARLFPSSTIADDAVWQGGVLAADMFWEFNDTADQATAVRMLTSLGDRFATSPFVRQAAPHMARLGVAPPLTAGRPPSPAVKPGGKSAPAAAAPARVAATGGITTMTAIRREVLPDALRVTIELEKEVVYFDERIDGPPRVFIDLHNTRAVESLKDATLTFPDDVVRQVRVGRQLNARTRVVLDLQQAGRHSVYTLYDPFRIVIDVERAAATVAATRTSAPMTAPAPVAAAAISSSVKPVSPATPPAATPAPPVKPAPTAPKPNVGGGLSLARQLGLGATRIVIDPGHGGYDPGAQGRGLSEAALTLDVALRLEKLLAKEAGVEVVLTRRTNEFVPLEERTAIANREHADLFLSIHANASDDVRVRGVETYVLDFAQTPAAQALAARENAASARTMGSLPDIVKSIALNNKIKESKDFAARVQAAMVERLQTARRLPKNLGVKEAPFSVLVGATMPSILTEISFITNQQEATWLKTQTYRQQLAEALFNGVMRYQRSLKGTQLVKGS